MKFSDKQVVLKSHEWLQQNHHVFLLMVLNTWGSSPRPAGSIAVVRDDGLVVGSVSGGCVEDVLVERLVSTSTITSFPHEETFGLTLQERQRLDLPCGGKLSVLIEKLVSPTALQALVEAMDARQLLQRRVNRLTGEVTWSSETNQQSHFSCDTAVITKTFGAVWRLLLIGAGQLSQLVAQFAITLGYEIIVCDPRENYPQTWNIPEVKFAEMMPDDAVKVFCRDKCTGVIALTHDPKLDDMALMEALKSRLFYVGALGSKNNNAKRRERLALLDLSATEIARLHGPVGLPIGSKVPEEIALSIMAEVTMEKNKLQTDATKQVQQAIHA